MSEVYGSGPHPTVERSGHRRTLFSLNYLPPYVRSIKPSITVGPEPSSGAGALGTSLFRLPLSGVIASNARGFYREYAIITET